MQKPVVLELSTHTHTKLFKNWDTSNSCYHFWWCMSPKHCEQEHRREQNWHLLWGKSKNKKKSSFRTYRAAVKMYTYATVLSMRLTQIF